VGRLGDGTGSGVTARNARGAELQVAADRRRSRRFVGLVFVLALVLRLLFWQSSVDAPWPGSASYKGDAWTWLEYASALQEDRPFELGIPIRPPAMAWVVDSVWDGGLRNLAPLMILWCALGALAVALFQIAATRAFGLRVGVMTGLLCAGSSGLMILSTSLNNETLYLAVLGAILVAGPTSRTPKGRLSMVVWGGLNALACLIRVEHALFFVLALAWWCAARVRSDRAATLRSVLAAGVAFGVALLPWHLGMWATLDEFNHGSPSSLAASERLQEQQERRLAYLAWEADAEAVRDRLPAFIRRPTSNFVAATVAHRGRYTVEESDFALVEAAFGYLPEPMSRFPFVVASGGFNFALANHGGTLGGFEPGPLEARPPLTGGAGTYPPALVRGLPPTQLAFTYPGHLRLINEGYSLGLSWIRAHPGDAAALVARKLGIFWRGASLGMTGWNLPLEAGGLRRAVDLATPEGTWPGIWRLLFLIVVCRGLVLAWRRPAAAPWLLFLGSKLIVTCAFYGYARQGATVVPVIAVLLALVIDGLVGEERMEGRALVRAAVVAGGLLLGAELVRFASDPELLVDGRSLTERSVPDPADHRARTIEWR